jgi:CheY-like chemotaxis protein
MRKIVIHSASAEMRALIRGMLSDIEALFVATATRQELFEVCAMSRCDLVLTDDVDLFFDGSNAIAHIRPRGALPQIFVISHNLAEERVVALLRQGVNQFISLPVAPERLYGKVSSQCGDPI